MKRKSSTRSNDEFNTELIEIAKLNPWIYDKKICVDEKTLGSRWSQIDDNLREKGIKIESKYIIFEPFL